MDSLRRLLFQFLFEPLGNSRILREHLLDFFFGRLRLFRVSGPILSQPGLLQ